MSIHATHKQWDNIPNPIMITPSVCKLESGDQMGTHVDALNHMGRKFEGQSNETISLSMFYTDGTCLNFSNKNLKELIKPTDIENTYFIYKRCKTKFIAY